MAPAFGVGSPGGTTAGVGRAGNGNMTTSLPSGWVVGQLAILVVYLDAGACTTPDGWTSISGNPFGSSTPKMYVFWKILEPDEPNPVVTVSGAGATSAALGAIATWTAGHSIGAIGSGNQGTGTPATAPQITTTQANSLVLGIVGRGDNEAFSSGTFGGSSTGVSERVDSGDDAGDDAQIAIYEKTIASSGTATGSFSVTTSATDPYVAVQIEILEDSDPSVTLSSPADTATVTDATPDLGFVGTDANNDDLQFQIQISPKNFDAVVIDTSGGAGGSATNQLTQSITVAAGNNRKLVVTIDNNDTGDGLPPASVTYAGQSLTMLKSVSMVSPNANNVSIWELNAPPVGTANLVVNAQVDFDFIDIGWVVYQNASQNLSLADGYQKFDIQDPYAYIPCPVPGSWAMSMGYPVDNPASGTVTGGTEFGGAFFSDTAYSGPSNGDDGVITHQYHGTAGTEDWIIAWVAILPAYADNLIQGISGQKYDLSDNFNDNSIDLTKWRSYTENGGTVSESSGALNLTPQATTNGSWAGIVSKKPIDLRGRSVKMKIVDGVGGNTYLDLTLCADTLPNTEEYFISIGVDTGLGDLQAYKKFAGEDDSIMANLTFNSTNHQYVRIREDAGVLYWEYSADDSTWTELWHENAPIDMSRVYLVIDDYEYNALGTPGTHTIDDFVMSVVHASQFVSENTAPDLVDSYSETNANFGGKLPVDSTRQGQSFNANVGGPLYSAKFYLNKVGSPTGNAVAKLYAHSGTFGTNSVPTGAALATSNNFDVSTLTGTPQLITFTFPTPYTLVEGTKYCIVIEYSGGDGSNYVEAGSDNTPGHSGNLVYWNGSAWASDSAYDTCFYVYVVDQAPFKAGDDITFTVPSSLSAATYYWRVRAKDQNAGNNWGSWSSTRSFTVSLGTSDDDERSAKISGKATANSDRSAVIHGKDTSNSERAAKVSGKTTANSERSASVHGVDTEESERWAKIVGKDTSNSERSAKVSGVDTENSERSAKTTGKSTSNSERSAKITGKHPAIQYLTNANNGNDLSTYTFSGQSFGEADSERYIVVGIASRKAGATTSITSVTIGGVAATIIRQQPNTVTNTNIVGLAIAKVPTGTSGNIVVTFADTMLRCAIGVWRLQEPYVHDDDFDTGDDPTVALDVPDDGAAIGMFAGANPVTWIGVTEKFDTTVESFLLYSGGSDYFSTGELGKTITVDTTGTETEPVAVFASFGFTPPTSTDVTSERSAKISGKDSDSDERSATIHGQDSESSDRSAVIHGKETSNSERSAKTTGKDSTTSERSAKVWGLIETNEERLARLTGKSTDSQERSARIMGAGGTQSERNASIHGTEDDSSERSAKVHGKESENSERSSTLHGQSETDSERSARLWGKDTDSSERLARLLGKDFASGERSAKIHGKSSDSSERGASIHGYLTTLAERFAKIFGQDFSTTDRSARVHGKMTTSSDRLSKLHGKITDISERLAKLTGKSSAYSERGGLIHGKVTTSSDRSALIHGKTTSSSERGAKITGRPIAKYKRLNTNGIIGVSQEIKSRLRSGVTKLYSSP